MNIERRPSYQGHMIETIAINVEGKELEVPQSTAAEVWLQTSKNVLGARMMDLANNNTAGALNPEFMQDYVDLLTAIEESLTSGEETWVPTLASLEKDALEQSENNDEKLGLNHVKQMDMIVSQVKSAQEFLDDSRERALLS